MVNYYREDFKKFLNRNMRFDYAIIDPPWNYNSKPLAVMYNQLTYDLWDNNDLKLFFTQLDVDYIFLWVTNSFIPNAIEAAKDSDFDYKTIFTWVKTTTKNNLAWGLGNTFRNCTEQILVFQRKKAKCLNLSMRNCILARTGKRTAKPKEFEKNLVNRLSEKDKKGVYIFSGGKLDFIDSVDIV